MRYKLAESVDAQVAFANHGLTRRQFDAGVIEVDVLTVLPDPPADGDEQAAARHEKALADIAEREQTLLVLEHLADAGLAERLGAPPPSLSNLKRDELLELAKEEGVVLAPSVTTRDEIRTAIEAHRGGNS